MGEPTTSRPEMTGGCCADHRPACEFSHVVCCWWCPFVRHPIGVAPAEAAARAALDPDSVGGRDA